MGEAVVPSDSEYDPAVHLNPGDARVDNTTNPKWMAVRLKACKTDPFRCGVTIYLGVTGKWLCSSSGIYGAAWQQGRPNVYILGRSLSDEVPVCSGFALCSECSWYQRKPVRRSQLSDRGC